MSSSPSESTSEAPACPNCDAPGSGRFCAACGQDNARGRLEFRPMLLEAFQNFVGWESSLVRTLAGLARDPGGMVAAYVAGRRRRFVNPARFALLTLAAWFVLARVLRLDPLDLSGFEMSVSSTSPDRAARIRSLVEANFDLMLYATLPLRALLLRVCFLRSERNLAEDMVFVLYLAGFGWILTLVSAPFLALGIQSVHKLLLLARVVWFVRAARTFYARSWFGATWRSLVVLTVHLLAMGAAGIASAAAWVHWIEG